MRDFHVLVTATLATLTLSAVAAFRWSGALPEAPTVVERIAAASRSASLPPDSVFDARLESLAERDPFRLANAPPAVRFDPRADAGVALSRNSVIASPLRPTFVLRGIVGGPPWQAIVDGIPGQPPGTTVHAGSSFDRIVVTTVSRDSVTLRGPDTSWTLTFRGSP